MEDNGSNTTNSYDDDDNMFHIRFENDKEINTLYLHKDDFGKFMRAIYNFCLDNRINAELKTEPIIKPTPLN